MQQISAEVLFTGLTPAQEANARALMPLAGADCDSAEWRVRRLLRDSNRNLKNALEALGFYELEIERSMSRNPGCWLVTFDVQVGEPVRLRNVDFRIDGPAASDDKYKTAIAADQLSVGEILNHARYERFKSKALAAALDGGYLDAKLVEHKVVVNRDDQAADVLLHIDGGVRYRFGETMFTEGILKPRLLRGFSDIKPGDPYTTAAINRLFEGLNGSSYFESVSINTEPANSAEKTVPVNVSLTPGARIQYSAGAGFATDTGPQFRLGYLNRRRNDKGHQWENKLYASEVRSELTSTYRWPIRDPRREWFSVVSGAQHEDTETSRSDTFKLGVLRARNRSRAWLETRYLDYAYEDFIVADQDTISQLIILGINWESARGRELSRVESGRRLSFDIRGASDSLGSDTSFAQFRSTAKWIHTLSARSRILLRANLGLTIKEEFDELPATVRFFAGGDRSVRGYAYEALGPVDDDGEVVGGSHLLTGSVELDYLLRPQWSVAAFVDAGSAFNDSDAEVSVGVGMGIRWYSPVGPIRVDFAHPLDDDGRNFRLHISLGPDL